MTAPEPFDEDDFVVNDAVAYTRKEGGYDPDEEFIEYDEDADDDPFEF